MEKSVIGSAKKYALKQGKSLSDIVENYLISITSAEDDKNEISPEIRNLMGTVNLSEGFDYKESLGKALLKKHSK